MSKPNLIREKALLSLFAYSSQMKAEDSTWDLTFEPETDKLTKLSVKALKHQLQALPKAAEQFLTTAPLIVPMLKTYEHTTEARNLLSLAKAVEGFYRLYQMLGNLSKQEELTKIYLQASALHASISTYYTTITNMAFTADELPAMIKALEQLKQLTQRVDLVSTPLSHQDETSISALIKASKEQASLKSESSALVLGTIENLDQLDVAIASNLQNYSQEQIGKVELSLLRLGAYEIMINKTTKGVVINDAIELARKYTSEDAVPLINAVLDKVS